MISRVWTATATIDGAAAYERHFRTHVLPSLQRLAGYHGAMLLQKQTEDDVELIVMSLWTSEDAIRQFAGPDMHRAVVADEARVVLASFDETVRHYIVVASDLLARS